jgi:hypothetical protein
LAQARSSSPVETVQITSFAELKPLTMTTRPRRRPQQPEKLPPASARARIPEHWVPELPSVASTVAIESALAESEAQAAPPWAPQPPPAEPQSAAPDWPAAEPQAQPHDRPAAEPQPAAHDWPAAEPQAQPPDWPAAEPQPAAHDWPAAEPQAQPPDWPAAEANAAAAPPAEPATAPPAVDPAAVKGHSELVPTVRYRGRPPAAVMAPAAPAESQETTDTQPAPLESEIEALPEAAASGTTDSPAAPVADQWHHKASSALGFHRSRHHLTKRETAGVVVLLVLLLVLIVVAILAVTGNLTGGREQPPPSPPAQTEPSADQPAAGDAGATQWSLGRDFHLGDFVLVVDSYEDGMAQLAESGSEVAEHGQWVLIGVTVKNAGDEDLTFLPEQQGLLTDKGTEFVNEPASALKHADFILGVAAIPPGGSQAGFLAFDIPIEDRPVALEFVGRVGEPSLTVPLG